jgi:RNA polymerase sigma-70 factor (ECF subfamily)
MKEASRIQAKHAESKGAAAQRRLELLRLRFQENQPIREIAEMWNEDPSKIHREYATAREEFRQALREIVRFHNPASTDSEITRQCSELIDCLK